MTFPIARLGPAALMRSFADPPSPGDGECTRPPDTRIEEFSGMLKCLDETLSDLPSAAPTVILMGDLNFPKTCITWQYSEEGILVPIVADCWWKAGRPPGPATN